MKELMMHLKTIPEGYYTCLIEQVYELSPNKIYMVSQLNMSQTGNTSGATLKYFFRLPTKNQVYEGLITEQLFEGICRDIPFKNEDIKDQRIYEYLYGKDTIRVIVENESIIAVGPEDNKEWQYEFQKYHV